MKELVNIDAKIFENIKHIDKIVNEYWYARELMIVLGYCKWENFKKVIEKAQISCRVSGNNVCDCFADVGKSIISGKGKADVIKDYHLNRYACYLIVQNVDPRKNEIALGQTYFVIHSSK